MAKFLMITATTGTNLELAERFAGVAREKGHDAEVVDLVEMDLPMFTVARSSDPEQTVDVSKLTQQMIEADAWIVVAPEYNGSMPPTLNNAIAWLSGDWQNFRTMCTGKPVGLATHSGGGGAHVIMAMRQMFSFIGADVMGRALTSGRNKEANPETIDAMIDNLA
ncbi:MAG TPA: NAD(P)H-dependent oxidoreductase [Candidatus Thalassarchaeaceae archaeon]|nr:MAG TPA: NADPH-dependent oxidoreductase [Candidatus Poseidoniales archaeon]HIH83831.1 NAD(P)H-dependent oxidoreductase [Candidatus Thalassarchaeaceae archaeon]|tara:strand:+ start:207 stop:701 length:495 start_codon:yes stop_codon:yes gene_type:complete